MEDCPWDGLAPGGTVQFCEARLCAWVVEPSNSWSNLCFVVVAAYLTWRLLHRPRARLFIIPTISLVMGCASFAFHATGTHIGEVIDDSAMYGVSAMFISFALARWYDWSTPRTASVLAAFWAVSILIRVNLTVLGIPFFGLQLVAFALLEIRMYQRRGPVGTQGWLWAMAATFAAAFGVWTVDATGLVCNPDNHIFTGHAAWHLGTATCLWMYYEFQRGLGLE